MELPTPPAGMNVTQGLDGIRVVMTTYRPSRLGQLFALLILLGALYMLLLALPAATVLGTIAAVLVYLLAGTLTGPELTIQITPRVLQETIEGRTRSWPLEELADIEEEQWSVLERRMGQIRFSTASDSAVIGGGNRSEEVRWVARVLRTLVEERQTQLRAAQPDEPLVTRPPPEILEMLKR
jgi:hypothetical protein